VTRLAAAALAALLLGSCGGHDHGGAATDATEATAAPSATFDIDMRDTAFAPARLTVPAGRRVTFVFHNRGTVDHEAFVGDAAEQDAHEAEMAAGGHSHGHHNDASVTVAPGKSERLTNIFTTDDRLLIGCHEPGHYKAGMRITIDVRD
jgi:uncharacterized cupredoxin-like copper-binding protein